MEMEKSTLIRILLQYLNELQLTETSTLLSNETQIYANTCDIKIWQTWIMDGAWDQLLIALSTTQISPLFQMECYECISYELIQEGEIDMVQQLLEQKVLKGNIENKIKSVLTKVMNGNENQVDWKDIFRYTRNEARTRLTVSLAKQMQEMPSSRLLTLMSQAMKYQTMEGIVPQGSTAHEMLTGLTLQEQRDDSDRIVKTVAGKLKFSKLALPQVVDFSLDGNTFISGSLDGFIEVWDATRCTLRKDLPYQSKDEFMMHTCGITALKISSCGQLLASGSVDGMLKMWKIASGSCLRTFAAAHTGSITSLSYLSDGTQILTSSSDGTCRIFGLKSGRVLKEFRQGNFPMISATLTCNDTQLLAASNTGTFQLWKIATSNCLYTYRPPQAVQGVDLEIVRVILVPSALGLHTVDTIIVLSRTTTIEWLSLSGTLLQTWTIEDMKGVVVDGVLSNHGKFLYVLTETGWIWTLSVPAGIVQHTLQVSAKEVYGMQHHPRRNLVCTYGMDAHVRFWKV